MFKTQLVIASKAINAMDAEIVRRILFLSGGSNNSSIPVQTI